MEPDKLEAIKTLAANYEAIGSLVWTVSMTLCMLTLLFFAIRTSKNQKMHPDVKIPTTIFLVIGALGSFVAATATLSSYYQTKSDNISRAIQAVEKKAS